MSAEAKRRAVLVGVGAYEHPESLPNLRAPTHDIRGLAALLGDPATCAFDEIADLANPTCSSVQRQLERTLLKAGPNDLVLLYYSGHGKLSREGGGLHLCMTDTELDLLDSTSLSVAWLRSLLDRSRAGQVVVLLDCCYSGAARGALKGADIPSTLQAHLGQGRGKFVVTASTAIQPSRELPEDRYSLFTKHLLRGLESWEADLNGDGVITLKELYEHTRRGMEKECPDQRPQDWGFDTTLQGEVILARRPEAPRHSVAAKTDRPEFGRAMDVLRGPVIPFLGTGLYGSGPLSAFALTTALAERVGLKTDDHYPVATVAEYFERTYNDRGQLIAHLREALDGGTESCPRLKSHQIIAGLQPPVLIVSSTYDQLLERTLDEQGKPYTVISHILRSSGGESDGKLLVIRRDQKLTATSITLADELLISDSERVIYKLLGSPYLHDFVDPELEIDTVVATETDHVTFLGRLDNQHTNVPAAFSLPFKKRPLLFLGYALDLWQYRLVANVFGRKGRIRVAVRQPTTPLEEICWKRLDVDLIHSDPEEFAETFLGTPEPARSRIGGVR